jgi:methylthioribulose-1-phosphate dehydratase
MMTDSLSALLAAGRFLATRGWTPATSGNLSVRASDGFWVTASGLDKGSLTREDLLSVDPDGNPRDPNRRPSAETALHTAIYVSGMV